MQSHRCRVTTRSRSIGGATTREPAPAGPREDHDVPTPTAPATSTAAGGPAPPPAAACCVPLATTRLSDEEAETTAAVFKALGDPHRVRIVNLLAAAEGPVCVCDLTPALGISQPTVSHHLKRLLTAGLVDRERRGTWSYYSLNSTAIARLAAVVDFQEV
jgi:ArsR family transcriptional regulator, arsenate/arsenite/antimonite-responsive transcriptional repressor